MLYVFSKQDNEGDAPFVSEIEIDKVNNFLRNCWARLCWWNFEFADEKEINEKNNDNSDTDELYNEALETIKQKEKHLPLFYKEITNW